MHLLELPHLRNHYGGLTVGEILNPPHRNHAGQLHLPRQPNPVPGCSRLQHKQNQQEASPTDGTPHVSIKINQPKVASCF